MTEDISLGECPCGEPATWYRVAPPSPSPADRATSSAVRSISLDDVDENLCDGCYKGFTGSLDEAVPGWKRVDVLRRQAFAGEESQTRGFDEYSQVSPEDEW
jgi:hypothetical protein